jgi:hypothetical protein
VKENWSDGVLGCRSVALLNMAKCDDRRQDGVDMKELLLPTFFLLLCACTPSSTKPAASVTGSNVPEAVEEQQREAVHGLTPR